MLAGPTCDSADVLYRQAMVHLPADLAGGDWVRLESAGAYGFDRSGSTASAAADLLRA